MIETGDPGTDPDHARQHLDGEARAHGHGQTALTGTGGGIATLETATEDALRLPETDTATADMAHRHHHGTAAAPHHTLAADAVLHLMLHAIAAGAQVLLGDAPHPGALLAQTKNKEALEGKMIFG